ncbi:MAG TPA: ATP-binding protein, partial [Thermoanaerobaculia bacterium]
GTGLHAIEESLVTQIKLIDELLDVSRIAAGKMHVELQPVDLGVVLDSAVELVGASAEAKQLALRLHVDSVLTVLGDAARLKQVIWNLLTNAIKFTPAGGTIDVSLRQRDAGAELVIRDSGEGIDPQFLPHVFDRFRQADSSINRRHGGLGIGLAIVSSLVDAHGGSVRAESEGPGKGATFTVTLPLLEQRAAVRPSFAEPAAANGGATLAGTRVLVVDDDGGARTLMTTTLRSAGAEVRECSSAGEAFEAVAEWRPAVLVSDLAMPDEDGYSLIRRLRASGHDVPAVAITAYVRSEDEARVRAAGFHRHVAKPFDPQELVAAVRAAL